MGARYGQHFLRNPGAVASILARFAPTPEDRVVEIGPGRGALTIPLASRVSALAAIEVDSVLAGSLASMLGGRLLQAKGGVIDLLAGQSRQPIKPATPGAGAPPPLDRERTVTGCRLSPFDTERRTHPPSKASTHSPEPAPGGSHSRLVVIADALSVRYDVLASILGATEGERLRVIGNLPYGVATALIQRMIAERDRVGDALIMVQKEVADRLLAGPGGKVYGFLSVLLALCADRERVLTLGPGSFSPPPKVRSTLVALRFHPPPAGFSCSDARLITILKIAFSARRKRMASNLARGLGLERAHIERLIVGSGADPGARAEQIAPEAFARLATRIPAPKPGSGERFQRR